MIDSPKGHKARAAGLKNISVPGRRNNVTISPLLLCFLVLGAVAGGTVLFLKNNALQDRVVRLETENIELARLQTLEMSNEWLKNRVAILQEEKARLLDSAVADLASKSRLIESILASVGVDLGVQLSRENSGGPYTHAAASPPDELMLRTEIYLDALQNIPLGAPVYGVITSRFGWRKDPINGKSAYHRGLDIRGPRGKDVRATAFGTVFKEGYDSGNGRYVLLDHGNGFRTKYAHLKKSLVKKGDSVARGDVVGLVGNSGRSTGPHVHYEIHYDDKIVNPLRFVRVAKYLKKGKSR
jgi:murein DD-endopeptidase MepM/ murein hydrolase activator NlpD